MNFINSNLWYCLILALPIGLSAQNDQPLIPAYFDFEINSQWEIDESAAKKSMFSSKRIGSPLIELDQFSFTYGDINLSFKLPGLDKYPNVFAETFFLGLDIYALDENNDKHLRRKKIIIQEDDLEKFNQNLKYKKGSTLSWRLPNALERAKLAPGNYRVLVNINMDGQGFEEYKSKKDPFFQDWKALTPHLVIGALAAGTTAIGLIEESNAKDIYQREYLTQIDGTQAQSILNDANDKYRFGQVLRWSGIVAFGANALVAFIRHLGVQKKIYLHNALFNNDTFQKEFENDSSTFQFPHLEYINGQYYASIKASFHF